jgi:hypothetical protein
LLVEGKELEIDEACAGEDRPRDPEQLAVAVDDEQRLAFVLETLVGVVQQGDVVLEGK